MIGAEFADRLSPLATVPRFDAPSDCDVCGAVHATCTGDVAPGPAPVDVGALVAVRAAQQTRRPPGRPPSDPEKAAAKVAAHEAAAAAEGTVVAPEAPVVAPEPVAAASDVPMVGADVHAPVAGHVVDAAGKPPEPVVVAPAGDPTEVRDCYMVPGGLMDPVDDPHRPDPATSVIVSEASQLVDTGAWLTLPGGHTIATTRDVLRVFWPMGSFSPSYATVAAKGAVLPKPIGPV